MTLITDITGLDKTHFLTDVARVVPEPHRHFYLILHKLWHLGNKVAPRGLPCKELTDFHYTLPPRVRFMCFDHRGLKMDYVKQELVWYLNGDRRDVSIGKVAMMWQGLINEDGTINSNYGYYLFW